MLNKTIVFGSIEILQYRQMQVRQDTVIDEDGVELSRTYHRVVYAPGDDVSTKPSPIPELAALLWTPEVVAAFKAKFPPPTPIIPPTE
jgi:hypothetical protein